MDDLDNIFDVDVEPNKILLVDSVRLNDSTSHAPIEPDVDVNNMYNGSDSENMEDAYPDPGNVITADNTFSNKRTENPLIPSDKGLSDLAHRAPKEFRLSKKKGQELKNLERLITYYQIWFHDVFPRAKLRDVIVMTEKLGHKRIIKDLRKSILEHINSSNSTKHSKSSKLNVNSDYKVFDSPEESYPLSQSEKGDDSDIEAPLFLNMDSDNE